MGRLLFLAVLLPVALGCSDGMMIPDSGDGEPDGGVSDAGRPADGGRRDASLRRDGGGGGDAGVCGAGMHMCLSGCEPDRPNVPEEGCRFGCGNRCEPPEGGTAMCDPSGACIAACEPPGMIDGDRCCGGALVCSAGISALLACPSPSEEPNETSLTPRRLGTYDDSTGATEGIMRLALPVGDQDWFSFAVTDSTTVFSTTTIARASVRTSDPDQIELAVWYQCGSGDEIGTCTGGSSDSTYGVGCVAPVTGPTGSATAEIVHDTDCSGTIDETGTALVRVRPTSSATMCAEYELGFGVES